MKVPDSVIRSARFQSMPAQDQLAIARLWLIEDGEIREGMREDHAAWLTNRNCGGADCGAAPCACPDACDVHGPVCSPQDCPCGHSFGCMCWSDKDG